jgi:hypothetical protein
MCLVPFWYGLIGTDVTLGNFVWRVIGWVEGA